MQDGRHCQRNTNGNVRVSRTGLSLQDLFGTPRTDGIAFRMNQQVAVLDDVRGIGLGVFRVFKAVMFGGCVIQEIVSTPLGFNDGVRA